MAENGNLDRLAAGLPLEERHKLLQKLNNQSNISDEPLYVPDNKGVSALSAEEQYARLPWYLKLWFFILSLFKARPPVRLFEDRQVAHVGRQIEESFPGLYDYQKSRLLSAFHVELEKLRDASRFFYIALDASFNRDKGAFYAFLGSLEMAPVHKKLSAETDPAVLAESCPDLSEQELRKKAFLAMDTALEEIDESMRGAMYFDARSLYCLKELSSFLFDRLIMSFSFDASLGGHSCSASVVKDLLTNLNNILVSLKTIPPMPLLGSLFMFLLQEKQGEPGFDINKEISAVLTKAEEALAVIREFNRQVPLTKILRCASRNMSLSPKEISGGEDWFVVYREYWKRRIEALFASFMREKKHRDLLNSFRYFLKGKNLKTLGNTVSETNPDGIPVNGALGLSFLLTFYSVVFMAELNNTLRPILIDGEFFRKENRSEFIEAYNDLIKLEDEIHKFEMDIALSGDFGKRYSQARQEMTSLPVKRRKIQLVVEEASGEALSIIESARRASRSMVNILGGIISKDSMGKYDSLSNFKKMAEKIPDFEASVDDALQKFKKIIQILEDIDVIDMH
ncbi:MAG: DUF5312 domain-containing protein [Treponema sp.]|jgi:hypothetical protein|nr:DUF5312 domain-containing protein [Treponema sp.]